MAHADYACCAVCDSKLYYDGGEADAKGEVCADCAVSVSEAAGRRIASPEALAEWIEEAGATAVEALDRMGFQQCYYSNPVDAAYRAARTGEATPDE